VKDGEAHCRRLDLLKILGRQADPGPFSNTFTNYGPVRSRIGSGPRLFRTSMAGLLPCAECTGPVLGVEDVSDLSQGAQEGAPNVNPGGRKISLSRG
jgi:hypothetical protein